MDKFTSIAGKVIKFIVLLPIAVIVLLFLYITIGFQIHWHENRVVQNYTVEYVTRYIEYLENGGEVLTSVEGSGNSAVTKKEDLEFMIELISSAEVRWKEYSNGVGKDYDSFEIGEFSLIAYKRNYQISISGQAFPESIRKPNTRLNLYITPELYEQAVELSDRLRAEQEQE